MTIQIYQRVKLVTERFAATDNVTAGEIGYVIESYPDGNYEVEFSDKSGTTYALIVVKSDELELAEHEK